jgi:hypothetical protein
MNDATVSPSWPLRQASLVVNREGYDGTRPQSTRIVNGPRDGCPAREIARHDMSVRSIRPGQNDLHKIPKNISQLSSIDQTAGDPRGIIPTNSMTCMLTWRDRHERQNPYQRAVLLLH